MGGFEHNLLNEALRGTFPVHFSTSSSGMILSLNLPFASITRIRTEMTVCFKRESEYRNLPTSIFVNHSNDGSIVMLTSKTRLNGQLFRREANRVIGLADEI